MSTIYTPPDGTFTASVTGPSGRAMQVAIVEAGETTPLVDYDGSNVVEYPPEFYVKDDVVAPGAAGTYFLPWRYPDPAAPGEWVYTDEPDTLVVTYDMPGPTAPDSDALPPDVTLDELKTYLDHDASTRDDEFLEFVLKGVCKFAIGSPAHYRNGEVLHDGGYVGRLLWPIPLVGAPALTHTVRYTSARRFFRIPDARAIEAVSADATTLTADSYRLLERKGSIVRLELVDRYAKTLVITGSFGFATTPVEMKDAIYTHAARLAKERDALYGDVAELPAGGAVSYFRQMPLRVRATYESWQVPSDTHGLE